MRAGVSPCGHSIFDEFPVKGKLGVKNPRFLVLDKGCGGNFGVLNFLILS